MEAPHDANDLIRSGKRIRSLFLWILALPFCFPLFLPAQEKIAGEGEHRSFIISEGKQAIAVGPVMPGQTIQVFCASQWSVEEGGRVEWVLTDGEKTPLRAAAQKNPETDMLLLEWTSNSAPAPKSYRIEIIGGGGAYEGEILGRSHLTVQLKDQNDGNAGTDAPESHAKALLLPATFHLNPVSAMIMLAGIYYGAQYGGSTTAILVNIPGEATSVVTTLAARIATARRYASR